MLVIVRIDQGGWSLEFWCRRPQSDVAVVGRNGDPISQASVTKDPCQKQYVPARLVGGGYVVSLGGYIRAAYWYPQATHICGWLQAAVTNNPGRHLLGATGSPRSLVALGGKKCGGYW